MKTIYANRPARSALVAPEPNVAALMTRQAIELAALVLLVTMLSVAHLAAVARPLFVLGAFLMAVRAIRRSPWEYLTLSLWIWSTAAFVRRLIDYYGGFQGQSIVLLAPNVLALLMIPSLLTSEQLMKRRETIPGLLLLAPVFAGLAVSFFKGEIFPGLIACIDWVIPLLYYFYLIQIMPRIHEGEAYFKAFVPLNLAVVGLYGVYQCFDVPAWDMEWVINVKMFTMAGSAGGFKIKPFSMLNSPGTCAAWVSTLILLSLHFRNRISVVVLPAAMFFLVLTQVRADLGAVVFGLGVAMCSGQKQIVKSLLVFIAVAAMVAGILSALDPRIADALVGRMGTVGNLGEDRSAQAREELYRSMPKLLEEYPLGLGIGGVGHGAVAGNNGNTDADFVTIDGGPIAIYLALGWVAGTLYLVGLFVVVGAALLAAKRSRSPPALALAITALGELATLPFTNLVGLQGIIIWLPAAYAIAIGGAKEKAADPYYTPRGTAAYPPVQPIPHPALPWIRTP
ncbi:MAG TPA: O-antigen ligase family protein [Alphaproteobacteria bacterium]|jgi:hypothetical protein|nr:O-antigen ligase family protein [Alphaproteobacteria bacterium]